MKNLYNDNKLRFLVKIIILYLFIELFIRLVFAGVSFKDISVLEMLPTLFLGIAYDFNTILFLLCPLALLIFLSSGNFLNNRYGKGIIKFMLGFFSFVVAFTSISEYYFWDEFHTRFNFIAVDYLVYTQELFGNIFQSYNMPLLLAGLFVITYIIYKIITRNTDIALECSWQSKLFKATIYVLVMVCATLGLSSGLKERVISNNFNQEIAGNGLYQFVYAFFHNELDYDRFYKGVDEKLIEDKIRNKIALTGDKFASKHGITRFIVNNNNLSKAKPNIVFIVVESLSARYTGMDNNTNSLTPKLDALASQGYAFNNVYATGTRTVRGLEAVSLNVPPTPGQSIVRREDCANLYNVGTALHKNGYQTEFIYGGYGYFDNMNAFFEGNKFEVIDRTDIPKEEIIQETVWGVADEILFDQCIKQLDKHHKQQEPVLQIVLTTTNHRPFTFPEGRIDAPQGKRESVVKYTDWAINDFINKARKKEWFDNTVFVVLADHNALAAGKVDLPISNYKIPCFIYAPKLIAKGETKRLMSQIDVAPTLLGMLGVSYETKNMGYDINRLPIGEERAFISTYQQLGFVKDDKLVVLEPGKKASVYAIKDYATDKYEKLSEQQGLIDEAITWYQGASYLYKNKLLKEK